MERLQSMHETVERLRSQLRTIRLESPRAEPDVLGADGARPAVDANTR